MHFNWKEVLALFMYEHPTHQEVQADPPVHRFQGSQVVHPVQAPPSLQEDHQDQANQAGRVPP